MKKIKSMRGKVVDMGLLMSQNEKAIAVGNANMNARGDLLGRGGAVVRAREEITTAYATSPKAVRQIPLRDAPAEAFMTPAEAASLLQKKPAVQHAPAAEKSKKKIVDRD